MSRKPRNMSSSGIYHIVFRGVNHCHLFEVPEDYEKMLGTLDNIKKELALEVYAYCLMSNHAHLLIKEKTSGDIVLAMRKLLGPYANWFNKKYQRNGALIANRFKSECVEDDRYLLTLVRYIHQNPLTAGAAKDIGEYRWSSYCDYINNNSSLTDTCFVLDLFADGRELIAFHEILESKDCSDPEKKSSTEFDIREKIINLLGGIEPHSVCGLPKNERDSLLIIMRSQGISIRQIERATGISKSVIARAK